MQVHTHIYMLTHARTRVQRAHTHSLHTLHTCMHTQNIHTTHTHTHTHSHSHNTFNIHYTSEILNFQKYVHAYVKFTDNHIKECVNVND